MSEQVIDIIKQNDSELLNKVWGNNKPFNWVKGNTAILITHGIGNQLPMETIDQFGNGLIQTYKKINADDTFVIEHHIRKKQADDAQPDWYDNFIRIRKSGDPYYIDLYEYYWAHYTEGKADWNDINDWLHGVTKGAKKYYKRNEELAKECDDKSALIKSPKWRYYLFIGFISHLILWSKAFGNAMEGLISRIPIVGAFFKGSIDSFARGTSTIVTNILGDLVAYMVTDAKSKYYPVRRKILDGAVKSISFLIEDGERNADGNLIKRNYPHVIIAGHSLGSQVNYDALNRINLMIDNDEIKSYSSNGHCTIDSSLKIKDQLKGFITFGSPLDKTAFFLRENIPEEQFVRQQMLNDYLDFKQRDWTSYLQSVKGYFKINNYVSRARLLDEIKWRNYFDKNDYVSGDLDYYQGLTNIDCQFGAKNWFTFTHSNYWTCDNFYIDIISNYLT